MISSSEEVAYQFSGVGSSVPDFEIFSSNIGGSECTDTIGQYDGSSVHQQTGGGGGTRSPHLCYRTWDLWNWAIQNNIQIKAAHILGKHNVLADQLSRNKVLPTEWTLNRSVVLRLFSMWGWPLIDLFASTENRQTQVFCSWSPHPQALALDALSISWENMFSYAYPPNLSHSQSSSAYEAISVPGYPDSSTVAQETLVHRPSSTSSGLSKKTSNSVKPITSAKKQDKSPKSRGVQLDCLASLNRNFKEKGFSKQARQLLTASWRKGTQKDYTSKFKKFCSWCHTRQIDPNSASLIQVADFLSGLFKQWVAIQDNSRL